jgi:hypothetical protein
LFLIQFFACQGFDTPETELISKPVLNESVTEEQAGDLAQAEDSSAEDGVGEVDRLITKITFDGEVTLFA